MRTSSLIKLAAVAACLGAGTLSPSAALANDPLPDERDPEKAACASPTATFCGWSVTFHVVAYEGEQFALPANGAELRYRSTSGATRHDGQLASFTTTDVAHGGITTCNTNLFNGVDPAPGERKLCEVFGHWVPTVNELQSIPDATTPQLVRYGAASSRYDGRYRVKYITYLDLRVPLGSGPMVPCSNAVFGDPFYGVIKHCARLVGGRIPHWANNIVKYLDGASVCDVPPTQPGGDVIAPCRPS